MQCECDNPPIFQKKRVFWGEQGQDSEQSKDLETRIKMSRGIPKNTIQCKSPLTGIPNFGWRAAAVGLKPLAQAAACPSPSSFPSSVHFNV